MQQYYIREKNYYFILEIENVKVQLGDYDNKCD